MCVVVWYLAVGEGCLSVFVQITRIERYILAKVQEEAVGDDRANAPGQSIRNLPLGSSACVGSRIVLTMTVASTAGNIITFAVTNV